MSIDKEKKYGRPLTPGLQTPQSQRLQELQELGRAPTLPSNPNIENLSQQPVEKVRSLTGCNVSLVAGVALIFGLSGTAAYLFKTKSGPFAPEQKTTHVEPTSTVETTEAPDPDLHLPDEVRTNEDLMVLLEAQKIQATEKDFEFSTNSPQLHAKVVVFDPNTKKWVPVTGRVMRTDQQQALLAVKVINPHIKYKDLYKSIVSEGLPFRARILDFADSTIMYFYFNGEDKARYKKNKDCESYKIEKDGMLGQVGIPNPSKKGKYIWTVSVFLPMCEQI
jgi:hypothetical protein